MRVIGLFVTLAGVSVHGVARAQEAPREHEGFQLAFRTAYAAPMGEIQEDVELSDAFSSQLALLVDAGAKISPHVFIGAYVGLGFGGADGVVEDLCEAAQACAALGFRVGAEVQYHFLPSELVNPWIGYGIGYESLAWDVESAFGDASGSYRGFEYARWSAGVDFRLSPSVGLGPFVDFSLGEYTDAETDVLELGDAEIDDGAAHQWLTLGVRGVLFP